MKIALIGTKGMNWGPHVFGGFETAVTELAPRLAAAGCDVTVYCRRHLYGRGVLTEKVNGVRLRYVGGIESKNFGTMTNGVLSVADALRSATDAIVLFNTGLGCLVPWIRAAGCRALMHLDGLEWQRGKWGWAARRMFELGAHVSAGSADELIADSREIQRVYGNRYGRTGVFIPYGARLVQDISDSLLQPYGIEAGSYYLLVTRFVPENNPLFVIEEFLRAGTRRSLVILGGNFYRSAYEGQIRGVKDPRVCFAGFIADPELLYAFYRYSYVYIHGHSVGGTNPTMLEALANSCCILALDTPFSREMLGGDRYGLFWQKKDGDLAERISRIDAEPALADRYRLAAVQRIHGEYNWDRVASQYLDLVAALVRGKSLPKGHPVTNGRIGAGCQEEPEISAGAEAIGE
ncbi:MAG: glycosyltransferase family 1 protein [Candidatus Eisenbacteria bacterium]|uniref:Glycosyltransferase family 1 protein n=1 Tax=Eiseniibacteriota bacterium TaxID=2212470 RepID=A0A538TAF8_UNCEI|nr:MAG: glycosyltransferase family 1 protein [Candidatus Eisenbacteria bacterium]